MTINGEQREVPVGLSIHGMLDFLGLRDQPLLVEHNGVALLKAEWETVMVEKDDRVELVRVVAGG